MTEQGTRKSFTAEHHAMLFAWIVREAIRGVGEEKAAPVIRKAVRRYGEQRGKRMAMRALANGHERSMLNYLAYVEWRAEKGGMVMKIAEKRPHMRVLIPRCCWHTAWGPADLMRYGKYYCMDVDEAIVRGFNPELKLEVKAIKPDGASDCEMVFHDLDLGPAGMLAFLYRKTFKPGRSALMPWDYHTGHIYKTVGDTIIGAFGKKGEEAVEAALAAFAGRYGDGAAEIVRGFKKTDFDRLPS